MIQEQVTFNLGQTLRHRFVEAAGDRRLYEDRWLKDLRQYRGVYDPEVLQKIDTKRSKAFVRLTRTKVKTMDARIMDMLFPSGGEQNWSLDKSPVADAPPEIVDDIIGLLRQNDIEPTSEEVQKQVDEWAESRAKNMSNEIKDQLAEGKYVDVARDAVHSGHVYGTGWIKGPLVEIRTKNRWHMEGAIHSLVRAQERKPFFEFVSIWDVYPDLTAKDLSESEYVFQRYAMPKHKVLALAARPDFNGIEITKFLHDNPGGDVDPRWFENLIESTVNEEKAAVRKQRKYELLEFWGYIDASDLYDCGCEGVSADDHSQVFANVWTLGTKVIKAVLNPADNQAMPYNSYAFERDTTSLLGLSVPGVVRDMQMLYNAATRLAIDNAAYSGGPQLEINIDLLADSEMAHVNELHPWKIWLRTGRGGTAAMPAVRAIRLPSHIAELMKLGELFKQMADEVSTIPSYMHGEQDKGVGRTVGGLSMLMGAANITMKDVIRNFDEGITKPFIRAMYDWNMQFNEKPEIKGDFNVIAKGSSSLVAKEIRAQTLANFAAMTANQIDLPMTDRVELLRQIAVANELPEGIVRSKEDINRMMNESQ